MNYESNTTLNTEAKSFIADVHEYSDFEERMLNKKACIAAEQQEQERRTTDADGEELLRRQNAKLALGLVLNSSKTSNQAPAFTAMVKEVMWNAGSNISTAVSEATETISAKVSEASAKVQDVSLSEPVIDARFALVNTAIHATQIAVEVGRKGSDLSHDISRKGAELSQLGEEKYYQLTKQISDRSALIAVSIERLVRLGDQAFVLVSDVLKRIAKRFSGWIQHTWEQAIYNANLSYSVHLAEKERKRRLTSEDESTAILNALAVSSLVKELAPELYRPSEEPSRTYAFALLEEKEQQHRIAQEKHGEDASAKAHQVADLVKAYQDNIAKNEATVKELLPVFTAEQVIYPDPMQIFEEPRDLAEELATVKPIEKLQEPAVTDSPQPLRAAM